MAKPRDPSSLPKGWEYGLTGEGMTGPTSPRPSAPRTPQGLLSYIEALGRHANDNLSSAPRHAPILAQASTPSPASTSLDEAHRVENRWPVIGANDGRARRQSILENSPAIFGVGEYAYADGFHPVHALEQVGKALLRQESLGATQVREHDSLIKEEADRAGIDPDLLRAIMYMEVSQGAYGYPAELLDWSDSILPMNVKRSLWGGLLNDGRPYSRRYIEAGRDKGVVIDQGQDALDDPRLNIRAGATLLRRIRDRLQDPSIQNIATLYNGLSMENVTDYGKRVDEIYRTKEWNRRRFHGKVDLGDRGP
jgi:hypothetical protein